MHVFLYAVWKLWSLVVHSNAIVTVLQVDRASKLRNQLLRVWKRQLIFRLRQLTSVALGLIGRSLVLYTAVRWAQMSVAARSPQPSVVGTIADSKTQWTPTDFLQEFTKDESLAWAAITSSSLAPITPVISMYK